MSNEFARMSCNGMTRRQFIYTAGVAASTAIVPGALATSTTTALGMDALRQGFLNPPMSSRPWVYYWWLEGVVTPEGITADLEEMKRQGISGFLVFDAGRTGPAYVKGPKFMSDEWRKNFVHTVNEAARLGMEMGISITTGWDAGGLWVERGDAIKILVWREMTITGPSTLTEQELMRATTLQSATGPVKATNPADWYRELALTIAPANTQGDWNRDEAKVLQGAGRPGERTWQIPSGSWSVLHIGYTLSNKMISLPSFNQPGYEIDPMRAQALEAQFRHTAALLIEDAGIHAGKTFKYTHIDSWEIGQPTWTQAFVEQFQKRIGYDPMPYLPALTGKTVDSAETTRRFQYDYRRVVADLTQENYYGRLSQLAHAKGLATHSEAGGPFYMDYLDGMAALGEDDIPMGEFWNSFDRGAVTEGVSDPFFQSESLQTPSYNRGSIKQIASAARIYRKKFCQAEAFTGMQRDWSDYPARMKADGDRAYCLGLGRAVIHHYAAVPDFGNAPGNQWEHISIHFNRYVTWWNMCNGWLKYMGRCQYLLMQGEFVADLLFYTGEAVPNFALTDRRPVAGFDYDMTNAEALLRNASVINKRITFGNGTQYRYLVIPGKAGLEMSPKVAAKLQQLVEAGATLIAPKPERTPGLANRQSSEAKLKTIADQMWDQTAAGEQKVGAGRVIWGQSLEDVLHADSAIADVEIRGLSDMKAVDWIHRRIGNTDFYFIANSISSEVEHDFVFRISGRQCEIWDAITGSNCSAVVRNSGDGRSVISLKLEASGSCFVMFLPAAQTRPLLKAFPQLQQMSRLDGAWNVSFDPAWGGPKDVVFDSLVDWSKHKDDGIRHYSGTATYRKKLQVRTMPNGRSYLDLGKVENIAHVFLNGVDLGLVWTAPWRVELTGHLREGENDLKVDVVNLWPNRLIKDGTLPPEKRLTKTNVTTYVPVLPADFNTQRFPPDDERKKKGAPPELLPSGLIGPVTLWFEVSANRV